MGEGREVGRIVPRDDCNAEPYISHYVTGQEASFLTLHAMLSITL